MATTTWREFKLGDCVRLLSGGTPSMSNPDYWGGEIPWVSCKDMKTDRLYDSEDHVTNCGTQNGTRLVPPGTVLIVVRGMILAKEFPVAIAMRPLTFNQDLKAIICSDEVYSPFMYYMLKANAYQIKGIADEAAHGTKRIQTDRLLNLPICLPPLSIQRKITAILSAYDDLIENNTRRIALLEAMAQALYREWFVRFRFPGHEDIPLADSPLGPIPEGWQVRTLASFGLVVTGKTPSTQIPENFGEHMRFIKIPDMQKGMFCIATEQNLSELGAVSQSSKTLPSNALCVSCIGTAGLVAITAETSQTNQQINTIVPANFHDREYLFFALRGLKDTITRYGANGATMVNLNKGKFESLQVIYPSLHTLDAFHTFTYPLLEHIKVMQYSNANLRRTRDLLLPKLVSGEVDVSEMDVDPQIE